LDFGKVKLQFWLTLQVDPPHPIPVNIQETEGQRSFQKTAELITEKSLE